MAALDQNTINRLQAALADPAAGLSVANRLAPLNEANDGTHLGFFSVTPVVRATAYTQTYSTTTKTVPAATYAAPTQTANTIVLSGTNIAAKTASLTLTDAVNTNAGTVATSLDQAQKDLGTAINTLSTSVASTNTQLAALAADVIFIKQVLGAVIDDLQAYGLLA